MRTSLKSPTFIGDNAPIGAIFLSILADAIQRPRRMAFAFSFVFLTLIAFQDVSNAQTRTWTNPNPGNLLTNSNWSGSAAPNAIGAVAVFGTNPTNSGNFTLNGTMTLGTLTYSNSTFGRFLTGSGTLTFQTSSGNALFHVTNTTFNSSEQIGVVLATTTEFRMDGAVLQMFSPITGSGGLLKTGSGELSLLGWNSYNGSTMISAGTMRAGYGTGSIPYQSAVMVSSGATLRILATEMIGSLAGSGSVTLESENYQLETGYNDSSTTFSGVISGVGGFRKVGTGKLTLSGTNQYAGDNFISRGILSGNLIGNSGLNSSFGRGNFSIANGATLEYTGASASTNRTISFTNSGGGQIAVLGSGTTLTWSGVISGFGGLTKSGAGTLQINGNNTYQGATTIAAGTFRLGNNERIPNGSALTVSSGATFNLNNFNETIGSLTGAGNVVFGSGNLITGGNNGSTTFSGAMSGSGSLTKRGSGTFTVSNNNTYSGRTLVEGGTLQVSGASGQISNTSAVVVGDANGNGNLTIQGGGKVNVLGTGSFIPGSTIGGVDLHSGRSYLGLNPGSVGTATVTGAGSQWESQNVLIVGYQGTGSLMIQNGGVLKNTAGFLAHDIGSIGNVTVTGAGSKWENSGNVYVGLDGIGNLIVNNSGLVSANELHVGFGSTLSGSGGIVQADVYNQGTLSPGSSAGILTIDGFYFQESAGVLKIELGGLVAGSGYDQLIITNNAILEGALEVSLINSFQLDENQWFDIVDVGGNLTGNFLGLGEGALVGNFGGHDLFVTYQAGDGNSIALYTSAIPEPGAGILMLMGIAVSLGFYRRRR
ncbi:MAG: autotransporter-associated beta strand repeat-containing protein [Pirellulaceae bacterium]|nr:autotransporter-associated beta strand repeat-containing protein [Pirellulaceae bacterium]